MAGRGWFEAISPGDVVRLLSEPTTPKATWDFVGSAVSGRHRTAMAETWPAIHGVLTHLARTGDAAPAGMAVLRAHLICQTAVDDFMFLKYPEEVAGIAQSLGRVVQPEFEAGLTALPDHMCDNDVTIAIPAGYVQGQVWHYFVRMRAFYQLAAEEGLAVLFCWG